MEASNAPDRPTVAPRPLTKRQLEVLVDAHLEFIGARVKDHTDGMPLRTKARWIELRSQLQDEIAMIDDCFWRLEGGQ